MIDVVYLAYFNEEQGYDLDVFRQFIKSYQSYTAGMEHNLTLLVKSSTPKNIYKSIVDIAQGIKAEVLELPDEGLDIGAFILAAKQLQSENMFCIGSGMTILCNDWLLKFHSAFKNDSKIKLAGAMGSYAQGHSDRFPNPHIRTCSFMTNRDLFLEYSSNRKFPKTKEDTWEIEHGADSLVNFILRKGFHPVVVNKDGGVFYPDEWEKAQTYITSNSKAIMEDKWARRYLFTDECLRTKIEMENWGRNVTNYPSNLVKEYSYKVNVFIPYASIVPVYSTKVFHPIFTGEVNKKLVTDALQDSRGENIFEKSRVYGELSAYYWVWKNLQNISTDSRAGLLSRQLKPDYVGFCQFYHFFDFTADSKVFAPFNLIYLDEFTKLFKNYTEENVLEFAQGYDVVVPAKIPLATTLYEEYLKNHKKEDLDLATEVIKELYPDYAAAVNTAMTANFMYPLGNFLMKREIFNDFCEWLFTILGEVEKRIDWNNYGRYRDIVSSSFAAERFLNIWLQYNTNIEAQSMNDIDLQSRSGIPARQRQADDALIAPRRNLNVKISASFMVSPDERKLLNKTMNDINQVKAQIKKK